MVIIGNRRSEPIRPAHTLLVTAYIIIAQIFPDGIHLLNVEKKYLFGRVFSVCAFKVIGNVLDIIIQFQIRATVAVINPLFVFGVRYKRALSNGFHGGNLRFCKIVQKTGFFIVRIAVNIPRPRRIAAQPLHLAGISRGIEPRAHIAVFPVIRTVGIALIIAAVRFRTAVVVCHSIVRKRVDHFVGKH